jgi:hypothetical protein
MMVESTSSIKISFETPSSARDNCVPNVGGSYPFPDGGGI